MIDTKMRNPCLSFGLLALKMITTQYGKYHDGGAEVSTGCHERKEMGPESTFPRSDLTLYRSVEGMAGKECDRRGRISTEMRVKAI